MSEQKDLTAAAFTVGQRVKIDWPGPQSTGEIVELSISPAMQAKVKLDRIGNEVWFHLNQLRPLSASAAYRTARGRAETEPAAAQNANFSKLRPPSSQIRRL